MLENSLDLHQILFNSTASEPSGSGDDFAVVAAPSARRGAPQFWPDPEMGACK
jgi:hypothetical protein